MYIIQSAFDGENFMKINLQTTWQYCIKLWFDMKYRVIYVSAERSISVNCHA